MIESTSGRRRVLAIVSRFNDLPFVYLKSLGKYYDLAVAVNEGDKNVIDQAINEGLKITLLGRIGLQKVEARLRKAISSWCPEIVHLLYAYNEEVATLTRRIVGRNALVVYECRDPLTTLLSMTALTPGADPWQLERGALRASDGQIFVSNSMRRYLEHTHKMNLSETSLIVPQSFCSKEAIVPPRRKLSADDGRVHMVLDGTVSSYPDHGRYYVNIIRRLVSLRLVVHSYFHDCEGFSNQIYRNLSAELSDYHYHEPILFREGRRYSEALSQYDLMGIFHELGAARHNESELLAMSLPAKAVSGWLCGGIPTVCFPHYKGIIENVEKFGIGFVAQDWDDIARITKNRCAIDRATEACLNHRHRFTTEYSVNRIATFYEGLLAKSRRPKPDQRNIETLSSHGRAVAQTLNT